MEPLDPWGTPSTNLRAIGYKVSSRPRTSPTLGFETETHPDKRKILLQLLAEEEAKHVAHVEAERAQNRRTCKSDMSDQRTPASSTKDELAERQQAELAAYAQHAHTRRVSYLAVLSGEDGRGGTFPTMCH